VALPALIVALGAIGTAAPDHLGASAFTDLAVTVTPSPSSTGVGVTCDLRPLQGDAKAELFDDGAHGDGAAGDLIFGLVVEVPNGTPLGDHAIECRAHDAHGRNAFATIAVTVISVCGDLRIVAPERCDDGGAEDADGCDASCQVEPGWLCLHEPSVCYSRCGDGSVVGGEECDDDNHVAGDGCKFCDVEPGWDCTGSPSVCTTVALCGDGLIRGDEVCDDGNEDVDDGCDSVCDVEPGWACRGEPSDCCVSTDAGLRCAGIDAGAVPPPSADDGCCGAGGAPDGALAPLLVGLVVLALVRLRR
jgi:cysteine-rich repeat protein